MSTRNDEGRVIGKIGHVTHYEFGRYVAFEDGEGEKYGGYITGYTSVLSAHFNQLKAKLYNAVEASALDERQATALKGLVRGFCNEHFKNASDDMRHFMTQLGFEGVRDALPMTAEPLEH